MLFGLIGTYRSDKSLKLNYSIMSESASDLSLKIDKF